MRRLLLRMSARCPRGGVRLARRSLTRHRASRPVRGAVGLGLPEAASRARPAAAGSPKSRELAEILRRSIPNGRFQAVPGGLRNVVGTIPGRNPRRKVVLGAHYDTKDFPGFVGANDAASGTAVVRELARTIKPQLRPTSSSSSSTARRRRRKGRAVRALRAPGSKVAARAFRSAEAAIVLDFVGDRSSRSRATGSRTAGSGGGRAAARRTGFARYFPVRARGRARRPRPVHPGRCRRST